MSHRQNRNQVALVGRNGAGKTTLLNLLGGNLAAAEGTARLLGTARTAPDPSLRQDVALVPTELLALHWMKVRQHFDFLASFYDDWDSARALALADSLDLDVDARVGSLSRGNSLKVALCSALGQDAKLLLLDEPTAGLDPVARLELLHRLESHLHAQPDVAMVFATRDDSPARFWLCGACWSGDSGSTSRRVSRPSAPSSRSSASRWGGITASWRCSACFC